MSGKVVTVQDYLLKKDPEKYEPIFKAREKAAKAAEKKDNEKRELLAEIQALEAENNELVKANTALQEELSALKPKKDESKKENEKKENEKKEK